MSMPAKELGDKEVVVDEYCFLVSDADWDEDIAFALSAAFLNFVLIVSIIVPFCNLLISLSSGGF